jgi:hypothetical protein
VDQTRVIVTLVQLFWLFALLSMVAFGGGAGVIPDIQRASVDLHQWLTAKEFLDLFAISRAAPGPGSLIAVLVGQKAAGLAGAAVAFVAMFGPSSLLVYLVARSWNRAARKPWRAHRDRHDLRHRSFARSRHRTRTAVLCDHGGEHVGVRVHLDPSDRVAGGRRCRFAAGRRLTVWRKRRAGQIRRKSSAS